MPWEPRTKGETLLPSREKVKEEEEEGGSLPLASGGAGTPPGAITITMILRVRRKIRNYYVPQHHHLPPSIYSGPLSRNPLYPLLEHGALGHLQPLAP